MRTRYLRVLLLSAIVSSGGAAHAANFAVNSTVDGIRLDLRTLKGAVSCPGDAPPA